jgi:ubiquinone/menaquinone biosynthesis C-methylase UbiE
MSSEAVAVWNAEAETFDEAPYHGLSDETVRSAWERLLIEKLPDAPGRIADLGCGPGTSSVLLADSRYVVDGLDFSPEMVRRAEAKAAGRPHVRFLQVDAHDPPLTPASYDVVLCRHVLWAMPDPAVALIRWTKLLKPQGVLLLVEGRWSNDVGLTADQTLALVRATGRSDGLTGMSHPVYWGRRVHDGRYPVVSPAP